MYLLFDIGGTKSRFAFTEDLNTFASEPIVFATSKDYLEELELIKKHVLQDKPLQGVYGGFPGRFEDNVLTFSPNLPNFVSKNLTSDFKKIFSTNHISIYNDAQLAALGEANYGAVRKYQDICFITLSTGIGGALVRDRRSLILPFSEPGHMIMDIDNNITFEETFSGGAIKRKFNGTSPDASDRKFWSQIEKGLAALLVNINMIEPVDAFVIGGGIVIRGNIDLDMVKEHFKSFSRIKIQPDIVIAELGDYSGLYGAMVKIRQAY